MCSRLKLTFAAAVVAATFLLVASGCGRHHARGNMLRYAMQTKPTQLDPASVEDGDTIDLLQQVFEGLVQWNEKNEVAPNVAQSWDISPDGRVYTFHLRSDVRFHNGRAVTADDFVYSLTRALLKTTHSTVAKTYLGDIVGAGDVMSGTTDTLKGVQAVDPHTLRITIDKRRPYFLGKLTYPTAYVVCREAIEKNGGRFDEKTMIGSGPFKLKSYRFGYQVELEANRDYHGGAPRLSGIIRPILTDSTARQTAYETGQTDFTDLPRADLDRIKADPKLCTQIREFPRPAIWYLALNQNAYPPFKDRRVRQAFACAINKDELIRLALKGSGQRANSIVPPGIPGYDPAYAGLPYDPARARKLLAQAGYPSGQGLPKLVISFRQGVGQVQDAVTAMRRDLQQNLGVNVDMRVVEWGQFLTERNNGTLQCYHLRWMADYLDPQDFLSLMLRTGAQENSIGYSNPRFDALCDQADVEPNPTKRIALYRQAQRIVVEDAPWVCLYFQHDLELHQPYVKNMRESVMGHLPHITTTVAH